MFAEPLKILDKLWDKIAKANNLSKPLKATLLVLVTLAILVYSFWLLFLIEKLADIASVILGIP